MSIPNLRAIRDWCKEKISGVEKSLVINGVQLYLDYQDGKYGVNTDPERGPDTFTPFMISGEGGGGTSGTTPENPDEPVTPPQEDEEVKEKIDFNFSGVISQYDVSSWEFSFDNIDVDKLSKILIKNYSGSIRRGGTSSTTTTVDLYLKGLDSSGNVKQSKLASNYTVSTSNTSLTSIVDTEINLEEKGMGDVKTLTGMSITLSKGNNYTSYTITNLTLQAEVQYAE